MKLQTDGDMFRISEITELGAANANNFRDQVRAALPESLQGIDIDLSQTSFLDSCGLGALIAINKLVWSRHSRVPIRLVNPPPPVQQILELTQMHRLFEIVKT